MIKGDIFLARFPVLFLTGPVGSVPEFLTAYISSIIPSTLLTSDFLMDPAHPDFATTKLQTVSVVRLHKLFTIHKRDAIRRLGNLSAHSIQEVDARMRHLLSL